MSEELHLVGDMVVGLGVIIDDVHQQFRPCPREPDNEDWSPKRSLHVQRMPRDRRHPRLDNNCKKPMAPVVLGAILGRESKGQLPHFAASRPYQRELAGKRLMVDN